jgi:hypothetical protein
LASWDAGVFFSTPFLGVLRGLGLAGGVSKSKVTDFLVDIPLVLPSYCRARATGGLSPPLKNVAPNYRRS